MKKAYYLHLILIIIIALILIPSLKVVGDDSDSSQDIPYDHFAIFRVEGLLVPDLAGSRIFFSPNREPVIFEPIILYLERQEKSPPA